MPSETSDEAREDAGDTVRAMVERPRERARDTPRCKRSKWRLKR